MREVLFACRNYASSRIFICLQYPDLLRTSCSPDLLRKDSEDLFSDGSVSIDTSTTEKDFINFSDNSESAGILRKSGPVEGFIF